MAKKKNIKKCPICSKLRPLQKHLYELSGYCVYLGNTVKYKKEDNTRIVDTETIASWLRLASELEKVEINSWKFSGDDAFYCESAADQHDSDSNYYTKFSTDLTRFIFICHSLEEAYRFVANEYDDLPEIKELSPQKRLREPSRKAAFLVDQSSPSDLPKHLIHIVAGFDDVFSHYKKIFSPQMTGIDNVKSSTFSKGLHLVRNLRNHIAHGVFPLLENPEYYEDDKYTPSILIHLLNRASRVSALYIQLLLVRYGSGFSSEEYEQIKGARGKEFKFFLKNCTTDYAKSLHFSGRFSFEGWMSSEELND